MNRRNFIQSVSSIPFISVPSIPDNQNSEIEDEERYWEFSSGWFPQHDWGRTIILEDDEIIHEWDFEDRTIWHKTTLLNAHATADCEYVADLFGLDLRGIYIDPPYFSSLFEDQYNEVQIRQGKYSEYNYVYVIETHDEEGLHHVEDGNDDIEELVKEVSELINL